MLSYGQLRALASDHLVESGEETVEPLQTLLLRWTNLVVQKVATSFNWRWLQQEGTFAFGGDGVGDDAAAITYLPPFVWRPINVWPSGRGFRDPLTVIGAWEFDYTSPSSSAGDSDFLVLHGVYGVARDNPTTGTIVVDSIPNAAGANLVVNFEGTDANDRELYERVTLNATGDGTTTNSFQLGVGGVRRIWLDAGTLPTTRGDIVFTRGGTEIERINTNRYLWNEYLRTELYPAPALAGDMQMRYYRRIPPLTGNTSEIVPLPYEFDDVVMWGVMGYMRDWQGNRQEGAYYWSRFDARLVEMKGWSRREPGRLRGFRPAAAFGFRVTRPGGPYGT